MLEYEGSVETHIVGLQASGIVHTTRQRGRAKGEAQERKGGNTMKDTKQRAKDILDAYVDHVKDTWCEDRNKPLVTTNVYDNFAKGVRAIMPDVNAKTIDEMYSASGFNTGKYRNNITATRWYETSCYDNARKLITYLLDHAERDKPKSFADTMNDAGAIVFKRARNYFDRESGGCNVDKYDARRAIDALVFANVVTKTPIMTRGKVHIYLYTFIR